MTRAALLAVYVTAAALTATVLGRACGLPGAATALNVAAAAFAAAVIVACVVAYRQDVTEERTDLVGMHRAAVGPVTDDERARLGIALPAVDGRPAPGARTVIDRWGSIPVASYPAGQPWDATVAEARQVLDRVTDAADADLLTGTDMRAWNNAMTVLDLDRDKRERAALAARKDADEARQRRVTAAHRAGVLRDRRTAQRRARVPAPLRRQWRTDRKADHR